MNWLSRKRATSRLGVTEPVFNTFARSGPPDYTLSDMFSDEAILAYQRFAPNGASTNALGRALVS